MGEGKQAKQVIVMRTDLNMRKGKMIAQGAHASIAFLTNKLHEAGVRYQIGPSDGSPPQKSVYTGIQLDPAEKVWIEGAFTKICVRTDSEEELLAIHQAAQDAGLNSKLIIDKGLTEFGGVPTPTCVGIGPNWADDIDKITGELKLL